MDDDDQERDNHSGSPSSQSDKKVHHRRFPEDLIRSGPLPPKQSGSQSSQFSEGRDHHHRRLPEFESSSSCDRNEPEERILEENRVTPKSGTRSPIKNQTQTPASDNMIKINDNVWVDINWAGHKLGMNVAVPSRRFPERESSGENLIRSGCAIPPLPTKKQSGSQSWHRGRAHHHRRFPERESSGDINDPLEDLTRSGGAIPPLPAKKHSGSHSLQFSKGRDHHHRRFPESNRNDPEERILEENRATPKLAKDLTIIRSGGEKSPSKIQTQTPNDNAWVKLAVPSKNAVVVMGGDHKHEHNQMKQSSGGKLGSSTPGGGCGKLGSSTPNGRVKLRIIPPKPKGRDIDLNQLVPQQHYSKSASQSSGHQKYHIVGTQPQLRAKKDDNEDLGEPVRASSSSSGQQPPGVSVDMNSHPTTTTAENPKKIYCDCGRSFNKYQGRNAHIRACPLNLTAPPPPPPPRNEASLIQRPPMGIDSVLTSVIERFLDQQMSEELAWRQRVDKFMERAAKFMDKENKDKKDDDDSGEKGGDIG